MKDWCCQRRPLTGCRMASKVSHQKRLKFEVAGLSAAPGNWLQEARQSGALILFSGSSWPPVESAARRCAKIPKNVAADSVMRLYVACTKRDGGVAERRDVPCTAPFSPEMIHVAERF